MTRRTRFAAAVCGTLLLAGCTEAETSPREAAAGPPVGMWEVTTSSVEARQQVEAGMRLMDMGGLPNNRVPSAAANERFKRAVTEDPSFAYAYLLAAITAPSFDEFRVNLRQARELAAGASEVERLQIEIEQKAFEGDVEEADALARRLTELAASNPRAWMQLAWIQTRAGQEEESRRTVARAVEIAPDFIFGHLWLANSYLIFEPVDWERAEVHVHRALELEPDRSAPHDLAGDLHRAHGRLDEAAASYTRAAELDPTDAGVLLQRGHAHTFSGRWDEARADYDASSELQRANAALPLLYRALVSSYAGDHPATIAELTELDGRLERMGLADLEGARIQLLTYQAIVAIGSGQLDAARTAVERRNALLRARADEVGTEEFRRSQEAEITLWEGVLATTAGDHAAARTAAARIRTLLENDRDPTKDRPVHALLGLSALGDGRYAEAVGHLERTDPNNEYLRYQRALALEGAGRRDEADAIYRELATNNFNTPELAVVRRDALARAQR